MESLTIFDYYGDEITISSESIDEIRIIPMEDKTSYSLDSKSVIKLVDWLHSWLSERQD